MNMLLRLQEAASGSSPASNETDSTDGASKPSMTSPTTHSRGQATVAPPGTSTK